MLAGVIIMYYFYLEKQTLESGAEVELAAEDVKHALNVLRLKPGDQVVIADGMGKAFRSEIIAYESNNMKLRLQKTVASAESPLKITLLQSLAKGDKMDRLIRQVVELGVSKIIPVATERSIPRLNLKQEQKRIERWQKIIKSAAAQSRRACLPVIENFTKLESMLPKLRSEPVVVPWEEEQSASLERTLENMPPLKKGGSLFVIIGPEGGFSKTEIENLRGAGAETVHLGPRILRTETAAVAVVTIAQLKWGDLAEERDFN